MKKITNCNPVGNFVLIEHLSAQEALGTKLHLGDSAQPDVPQAVILAIGPNVDVPKFGFSVGDRVIVQGSFVPVPDYGDSERRKGLVDPHAIKGVLQVTDDTTT